MYGECVECGRWYQEDQFEFCFEVTFPPNTGFLGLELESTERLRVGSARGGSKKRQVPNLSQLQCLSDPSPRCTVKPHNVVWVKSLTPGGEAHRRYGPKIIRSGDALLSVNKVSELNRSICGRFSLSDSHCPCNPTIRFPHLESHSTASWSSCGQARVACRRGSARHQPLRCSCSSFVTARIVPALPFMASCTR